MESIDLSRAFKVPFQDKDWLKKSALAIVWYFLVVTTPVFLGASLDYIKRVSQGDETLPDWSEFGDKWVKGLLAYLALMIFMLPPWLLIIIIAIPAAIGSSAGGNEDVIATLAVGGICIWYVFILIYSVAVYLYFYAALVNYAMKGNFGAFFEFREIWARMKSGTGYWMALLYSLVVGLALEAAIFVLMMTVIGYIAVPAVMYLGLMGISHLLGQWARKAYAPAAPELAGQE